MLLVYRTHTIAGESATNEASVKNSTVHAATTMDVMRARKISRVMNGVLSFPQALQLSPHQRICNIESMPRLCPKWKRPQKDSDRLRSYSGIQKASKVKSKPAYRDSDRVKDKLLG